MALSDGQVPDALPSPYLFNHAMVGIPWSGRPAAPGLALVDDPDLGALRVYDPTLPDSSPQDIDPLLEGGAALVAHRGASHLLRLPGSPAADNVLVRELELKLAPDGSSHLSARIRASGAMRLLYTDEQGERFRPERLRENVYERLSDLLPEVRGLEVDAFSDDPDGRWTFGFRASSPALLATFGALGALELGPLLDLEQLPAPAPDSDEPAHLPMLGIIREVWTIEHEGLRSVGISAPLGVANDHGHVRVVTHREPERTRIEREVGFGALEVAPERRDQVLALRAALRKANSVAAIFEP